MTLLLKLTGPFASLSHPRGLLECGVHLPSHLRGSMPPRNLEVLPQPPYRDNTLETKCHSLGGEERL